MQHTENERWGNIFHANENQNKTRITILISDNIDFKIKTVKREKVITS